MQKIRIHDMKLSQLLFFTYQRFRTKGLVGLWRFAKLKVASWLHPDIYRKNFRQHADTVPTQGITFIADLCGKDSISKMARDFVLSLKDAGIPFQAFDPNFSGDPSGTDIGQLLTAKENFNIRKYTVVAEMFEGSVPDELCTRHICIPFWEFESGFLEIHPKFAKIKEVAGMSDFNVAYYRRILPPATLVHKILYPLRFAPPSFDARDAVRSRYGIGEKDFAVFFNFSYLSGYHRKNPEAVLHAFALAFKKNANTKLVFKTMRSKDFPKEVARLRNLAQELGIAEKFISIDTYIPHSDIYGLTAACDCYISLHRGEGFGLGVAEAMLLGRPVVVSDYSSTREFCTVENSIPIPCRLIPVKHSQIDNSFYSFVTEWADPDIPAAATALRRLYADASLRQDIGHKAQAFIKDHFSIDNFRASIEAMMTR